MVFVRVAAVFVLSPFEIDIISFEVEDILPVASASISRSFCSNKAFFFPSTFKSVFCCMKSIACFFVVTKHVDVAPVLPVMSVW